MTSQHQPADGDQPDRRLTRGEVLSFPFLAVPGLAAGALSWRGQYEKALEVFPQAFAAMVPVAVDGMIVGCGVRWVSLVRAGKPAHGWRATTHLFVAITILLNGLAAHTPGSVPWHLAAPAAVSLLVELIGRDAARRHREEVGGDEDRISFRMWVTDPVGSARAWVGIARSRERAAFAERSRYAKRRATIDYLGHAVPGKEHAGARSLLVRHLEDGSLTDRALVDSIDAELDRIESTGSDRIEPDRVDRIVRAALRAAAVGRVDRPEPESTPIESAGVVDPIGLVDRPAEPSAAVGAGVNGSAPQSAGAQTLVVAAGANGHRRTTAKVPDPNQVSDALEVVKAAIAANELPQEPSAEAIRRHIRKAPKIAQAVRDHLRDGTTPETP